MRKNMHKNQRLLLQARAFFVDAKQYDEYELAGYYRLIVSLCKKTQVKLEGPMAIANIYEDLRKLEPRLYNIVRLRCWEGYTRDEIGSLMAISGERVRQLEDKAQKHLYTFACKKQMDVLEQPIEVLKLSTRGYCGLKRVGVSTIGDLMKVYEQDIFAIKGVGVTVACDIEDKLKSFIQQEELNEYFENLPIDVLEFSNRVRCALKSKGIYIVRQFCLLPLGDVYRIKGIGEKSFKEIEKKKKELQCKYNADFQTTEEPYLIELDLSQRAMRCIENIGVTTVEEFLHLTKKQVLDIWHVGEKTWQEIYEKQQGLQRKES